MSTQQVASSELRVASNDDTQHASRNTQHLLAFGIYALLSVVVTWPMAATLGTKAIGTPELYSDRAQSIWNLWWVKEALLDRHTNPFHTDLLLYPQGADLYFHTLNLPSTLLTLVPMLLFGTIAAYNLSALFALTLSGYAGFRLVHYVTGNWHAGLLGGVVIGFNTLSQVMLRGEINVLSMQWFVLCIEFYLRAWAGKRRGDAVLCGLFFVLSVLTVGYFEVQLLIFFAVHLLWTFRFWILDFGFRIRRKSNPKSKIQNPKLKTPAFVLAWAGGTAAILLAPYLAGAWLSLQQGNIIPWSSLDERRTIGNSADLLSFVVPNRDHWLLGALAPWWAWVNPLIHDFTYLGIVAVALSAIGIWHEKRRAETWFWVVVGCLGILLAVGPFLQVNRGETVGGAQVPTLFTLARQLPLFNLIRAPERFVFLTYVALGVLAGWGFMALTERLAPARRTLVTVGVLALLVLDMPLHEQALDPMSIPGSLAALGKDPGQGALMELPFTQHGRTDGPRMLYQTAHGRPITGAYLSRAVADPYADACSPLQAFARYPASVAEDIVSPTASDQLPVILNQEGVRFIGVYKEEYADGSMAELPQADFLRYTQLAEQLATPAYEDDMAHIYRVRPSTAPLHTYLQLGPNWHQVEESHGKPFRWINGSEADLCVFSPAPHTGALTFQATGFGPTRHLQVWIGDKQVLTEPILADGVLRELRTAPVEWPSGAQRVRLVSEEASVSPQSLGQGDDSRQLSIGVSDVRLVGNP